MRPVIWDAISSGRGTAAASNTTEPTSSQSGTSGACDFCGLNWSSGREWACQSSCPSSAGTPARRQTADPRGPAPPPSRWADTACERDRRPTRAAQKQSASRRPSSRPHESTLANCRGPVSAPDLLRTHLLKARAARPIGHSPAWRLDRSAEEAPGCCRPARPLAARLAALPLWGWRVGACSDRTRDCAAPCPSARSCRRPRSLSGGAIRARGTGRPAGRADEPAGRALATTTTPTPTPAYHHYRNVLRSRSRRGRPAGRPRRARMINEGLRVALASAPASRRKLN
jgi:hypothetical protein